MSSTRQKSRHPRFETPGIPTTATQADTPHELVEPAAHRPGKRKRVPAVLAADRLDDLPELVDGCRGVLLPHVRVHRVARPVGVTRQRVTGGAGDRGVLPARLHLTVTHLGECEAHRLAVAREPALGVGNVVGDVVLARHAVVLQRRDDRHGELARNRCDEVDPLRREPGRQHRQRGDRTLAQARLEGVPVHHLAVAQHVGAADVERTVDLGGQRRRSDEVVEHVTDGDRLDEVAHPLRRWHVRQHLGEVPDHLERCGTRADHGARLERRSRNARRDQNLPHLGATAKVSAQLCEGNVGVKTPEVDDAFHTGGLRCRSNVARRGQFRALEISPGPHGVHEVVGDIDSLESSRQCRGIAEVAGYHLDPLGPRHVANAGSVSHENPHLVPGVDQPRREAPSDVPGRAGDEDAHGSSLRASTCVPTGGCPPRYLTPATRGRHAQISDFVCQTVFVSVRATMR